MIVTFTVPLWPPRTCTSEVLKLALANAVLNDGVNVLPDVASAGSCENVYRVAALPVFRIVMVRVAAGKLTEAKLADWVRSHLQR